MVNRTMQAKAMKRRRQLRRLPRRLDDDVPGQFEKHSGTAIPKRLLAEGVSAPRQPNRELMEGYKHRSKSLERDEHEDNLLILLFYGRLSFPGVSPSRKEVIEHIARIKAVSEELRSFDILCNRVHRARVFYNSQKTKFILSYENYKEGVIRTSMTYQFRQNLIDDFRKDKLVWVEIRSSG
jgi:hypothetical protein